MIVFADIIVHHRGRFYTLTMKGTPVSLNFCQQNELKKDMVIAKDDSKLSVITRYPVSTPWGDLLQVHVILDKDQKNGARVKIDRLPRSQRSHNGRTKSRGGFTRAHDVPRTE
jgi:hypothetical protein